MKKFLDAFHGIKLSFNHKAIVVQFVLGVLAIIGGIIVKLDYYEWLAFIICIALVIALEIANTCIEYICNYVCDKQDEKIKTIKDMSAAFVLVMSIGALAVCVFVIIRRLF